MRTNPLVTTLRFYAELNDFLPPESRQRDVPFSFYVAPTAKDAVESLGVPHVEVEMILVNGRSVGFEYRLKHGDRVAVYPVFESVDVSSIVRLRDRPLRDPVFVADVHLRRLARLLRLVGFDVIHDSANDDPDLVRISIDEGRILLTRDRALLKYGGLSHGVWIRSTDPIQQAREVVRRFDLAARVAPFSRCAACNGRLVPADKASVVERIPPKTAAWLDVYMRCEACDKLYWRGTHAARLDGLVDRILRRPDEAQA